MSGPCSDIQFDSEYQGVGIHDKGELLPHHAQILAKRFLPPDPPTCQRISRFHSLSPLISLHLSSFLCPSPSCTTFDMGKRARLGGGASISIPGTLWKIVKRAEESRHVASRRSKAARKSKSTRRSTQRWEQLG